MADEPITEPFWVDVDSGTWGQSEIRFMKLTGQQADRLSRLSDSDRIMYARNNGKLAFDPLNLPKAEALAKAEMGLCDVTGQVDFGNGMVSIRCTRVNEHTKHECRVGLYPDEIPDEEKVRRTDND